MTDLATREPTDRLGSPIHPPRYWFYETPEWVDPRANGIKTILDGAETGRAAGYVWDWETCNLNERGVCQPFTPSPTGLEVFYSGGSEVLCEDGTTVNVGVVPYRGGHAPLDLLDWESREFYDNPAYQGLVGRIVEDDIGGLFLGQVVPHLTVEDAALIARSKVSGHMVWRQRMRDPDTGSPIGDGYDQVGPTIVSTGALPRASRGYARVAGLNSAHPDLVGPWIDDSLQERIIMTCARCSNDHPETVSCAKARVAAAHDLDPDDPTGSGSSSHGGTSDEDPGVGQGSGTPTRSAPLNVDLRQMILDSQAVAAQVSGLAATQETISGTLEALTARIEEVSSVVLEIEQRLNDRDLVMLDETAEERLDSLERTTAEIRTTQATPATSEAKAEAAPAA